MSKTLRLFGLQQPSQDVPVRTEAELIRERMHYGIPAGMTSQDLTDFLQSLDKKAKVKGLENALQGVDLAFAAMEIMRNERKPDYMNNHSGLTIPRPFVFTPGTAVLKGMDFAFTTFARNADGFDVSGSAQGIYASYKSGDIASQMYSTASRSELEDLGLDTVNTWGDGPIHAFYLIGRHLIQRVGVSLPDPT